MDPAILQKFGTIEVVVSRVIYNTRQKKTSLRTQNAPRNIGPVHEKSKKVGGHCVS